MNQNQKNQLLEALFDHVAESIIVADTEGIIKLANPASEKLFGYNESEMVGKRIEMLMPQNFAQNTKTIVRIQQKSTSKIDGNRVGFICAKKNGTLFPVEISLTPFNSSDHCCVIAFIIDITKRKKVEHEITEKQNELEALTIELKTSNERLESKVLSRTKVLSEALSELEKSQQELKEALEKEKELNELKSRFVSMASHEFRTPLTAILSSASLIDEYITTEQQDKRTRHVNRIKSAVNNLNDILSDFLSISKIEEGKIIANYSVFDVHELITDTQGEMRGLLKDGQDVNYTHQGEKLIYSDKKLIRNVIINLVSNAIKFSPEDSQIEIATAVNDAQVIIKIKDNGMGISKEDKTHLFERFFRGQNATNIQGTGLGLNIVANYVELLNGFIELESELDLGTEFIITLPNKKMNQSK
nr:PAS domain-containing sensor histidine kinase [Bacteroidota bacterium]